MMRIIIVVLLAATMTLAQDGFLKRMINTSVDAAKKIKVIDLDKDGDLDVVAAAAGAENILWFENDGSVSFSKHIVSGNFAGARAVDAADIDMDGDIDIIAGSVGNDAITWWESDGTPADGGWIIHDEIATGLNDSTYSVNVVDFDNDNDPDILGVFYHGDSLGILDNDGSGNFSYISLDNSFNGATDITAGYINNDSRIDIIASAYTIDNKTDLNETSSVISYWEQNSGNTFGAENVINTTFKAPNGIAIGDIDSDGDNDIAAVGWTAAGVLGWFENDGNGSFVFVDTINASGNHNWGRNVVIVDIDSDGYEDLLATEDLGTGINDDKIVWYENDGNENFVPHEITTTFGYPYFAEGQDFDGDGDVDIIASAEVADEIAWWENRSEERLYTASGDVSEISFFNDAVKIDFSASTTADTTRVFYNPIANFNRTSLGAGIDHIAVNGFYTLKTEKTGYTCTVTFDYSKAAEWSAVNDPQNLVICHWDTSTLQWVISGSTQDSTGTAITVHGITTELASFSRWTLASKTADNPLPVELTSFNAEMWNSGILLSWETQSEIDNAGFELYRKPDPDSSYILLTGYKDNDALKGSGTSNLGKKYYFTDHAVQSGHTYYYKLADVAYNGKITEHQELKVSYHDAGSFVQNNDLIPGHISLQQNYPNPFNNSTYISISIPADYNGERFSLTIYNELGQKVKTIYDNLINAGNYTLIWDGSNDRNEALASGVYFYIFRTRDFIRVKRMTMIK